MNLKGVIQLDMSEMGDARTIDISGTQAPKATLLCIRTSSSAMSYPDSYPNLIESIKANNLYLPSLQSLNLGFAYNVKLQNLETKGLNTDNVTNMSGTFRDCYKITSEGLDISHWNTSKVTTMTSMFENCNAIEDYSTIIKNFNTEKVQNMNRMFYSNDSLKHLNLNHFKVPALTNMESMFYQDNNLETIE
jgi:surface protein